jgi:hemoglobin-like flavoprotein
MVHQGEHLMGMLGRALGLLDRPAALLPLLRLLGARHRGYGVRDPHYDTVGTALLATLEHGLGAAYTDEVRAAWTEVYALIRGAMLEGAQAPLATA